MDMAVETEIIGKGASRVHSVGSRDESDDDVGTDFCPCPVVGFGEGGEDVDLAVVEDFGSVRFREAGLGFFEGGLEFDFVGEFDAVGLCTSIAKKLKSHLSSRLKNDVL
jgi:hypothetical protein